MSINSEPLHPSLLIGLTGGIGSGKTTVSNLFAEFNITVVDADEISRELLSPDTPACHKVIQHFGQKFLLPDGNLNRSMLRTKIFNDAQQKRWLEALLHPLIRAGIQQQVLQSNSTYTILSAPLLLENQHFNFVDRILVVDVPTSLQVSRTVQRDNSNANEVSAIIAAQMTRERRLALADDVIHNNSSLQDLAEQVQQLHQYYLNLAQQLVLKILPESLD